MKHVIALVLGMILSLGLHAEYLYWQVATGKTVPSGVSYDAGRIWATTGKFGDPSDTGGIVLESFTYVEGTDGGDDEWVSAGTIQNATAPSEGNVNNGVRVDVSTLSSPSSYSFYIELIKYESGSSGSWSTVGYLSPETYANLKNNSYIVEDAGLAPAEAAIWTGGSFSSTPEPTSGLLFLVGASILALRRKRQ